VHGRLSSTCCNFTPRTKNEIIIVRHVLNEYSSHVFDITVIHHKSKKKERRNTKQEREKQRKRKENDLNENECLKISI
jgi:hypothetical protein